MTKTININQPVTAEVVNIGSVTTNITYSPITSYASEEERLRSALSRFERIPKDGIPPLAALPFGSCIPSRNAVFIGRQNYLEAIAQSISREKDDAIGSITAISGLGGIGKSQLVREFASRYGQFFLGGVFWMSFTESNSIDEQIAICGRSAELSPGTTYLPLEEQVRRTMVAWQSPLPRLLIFDGCEDEALVRRWRPVGGASHVLITCRRDQWDPALGITNISLHVLDRTESTALLCKYRSTLDADDPTLSRISQLLGDLPLAIHMAGSYMHRYEHVISPAEYLARISVPTVLEHPSMSGKIDGFDHSVERSFSVSFDQLSSSDSIDALAKQLLERAACVARGESIPRALASSLMARLNEPSDPLAEEDAIRRACELGLLEEDAQNGSVKQHQLIGAYVEMRALNFTRTRRTTRAILGGIACSLNESLDLRGWQGFRIHLDVVSKEAETAGSESAAFCLNVFGTYLENLGDMRAAKHAFECALHTAEMVFGAENPYVAAAANNLGSVLHRQGDLKGARLAIERALRISEKCFGPNDPTVARDLDNLSSVLLDQGDLAAARLASERAVEIDKENYGDEHPIVGLRLKNLSSVLLAQGDLEVATSVAMLSLEIAEKVHGPEHTSVAACFHNIGALHYRKNELSDARKAFERAHAIYERMIGQNNPSTAGTLGDLATVLQAQGDLPQAREMYERSLAIIEGIYGEDYPDVAVQLNNLGNLLVSQNDYEGARRAFLRALSIVKRLCPEHSMTLLLINNFFGLLAAQGDTAELKRLLEHAADGVSSQYGPEHPATRAAQERGNAIVNALGADIKLTFRN